MHTKTLRLHACDMVHSTLRAQKRKCGRALHMSTWSVVLSYVHTCDVSLAWVRLKPGDIDACHSPLAGQPKHHRVLKRLPSQPTGPPCTLRQQSPIGLLAFLPCL